MMKIGMLWFDNDPKLGLDAKIERGASYYNDKYGKPPTVCFVHPSMIPEISNNESSDTRSVKINASSGGLTIRSNQTVLPNHFWIGVNGIKSPSGS